MRSTCQFDILVIGEKENREKFFKMLSGEDENIQIGLETHAVSYVAEEDPERAYFAKKLPDAGSDIITGFCGWSVHTTFINKWSSGDKKIITLKKASKMLNLSIEVISSVSSEYMEHYIFKNGSTLLKNEVDLIKVYINPEDTKEDVERRYNVEISDKEWEQQEGHLVYGGIPWEFILA